MIIKIKVTKDILERSWLCGKIEGKMYKPINCAISLAILEIFPSARVLTNYIDFGKDGVVKLPKEASNFIVHFDKLSPIQRIGLDPMSFDIDLPHWLIDKINISQLYRVLSESRTLELVKI